MSMRYPDRSEAGRQLADALERYQGREDLLVLALPRGGVPVAAEVARALHAPLDIMLVRKLGVPGHEELAMGAIATGGALILNRDLIEGLGIRQGSIDAVMERERRELARREQAYRGKRPLPPVHGRCVIVVDDGVATGATMRAAIKALRQYEPGLLVIASPVIPPDTLLTLREDAHDVVCLQSPSPFYGVGNWYSDFSQTSDEEVRSLLLAAWRSPAASGSVGEAGHDGVR
jgi:putative phosphoribosyl transferase